MGKFLKLFLVGLFFVLISGAANADLIAIGEATYGSGKYNLIWDKDNNGKSLVWLDYTDSVTKNWDGQRYFVDNLNGTATLTYAFYSGYTVNWDSIWRLPSAGASPSYGFNQTGSEMGHLFYDELHLTGFPPATTPEALNLSNFDNLIAGRYWSGTKIESTMDAWAFEMNLGRQVMDGSYNYNYGLFLREADVSTVPEPATMILFGLGLLGLAGVSRKKR